MDALLRLGRFDCSVCTKNRRSTRSGFIPAELKSTTSDTCPHTSDLMQISQLEPTTSRHSDRRFQTWRQIPRRINATLAVSFNVAPCILCICDFASHAETRTHFVVGLKKLNPPPSQRMQQAAVLRGIGLRSGHMIGNMRQAYVPPILSRRAQQACFCSFLSYHVFRCCMPAIQSSVVHSVI